MVQELLSLTTSISLHFFYVKLLHAYEIKLFSRKYAFFFQFNLKALTTKLKRVEEKFFFPLQEEGKEREREGGREEKFPMK